MPVFIRLFLSLALIIAVVGMASALHHVGGWE